MRKTAIPPFTPVGNEKTIPLRYHPPIPPSAPVKNAATIPPPDTGIKNENTGTVDVRDNAPKILTFKVLMKIRKRIHNSSHRLRK